MAKWKKEKFPCSGNAIYNRYEAGPVGYVKPHIDKEYGCHPYGWGVLGTCSKCEKPLTFVDEDTGKREMKIRPCMSAR